MTTPGVLPQLPMLSVPPVFKKIEPGVELSVTLFSSARTPELTLMFLTFVTVAEPLTVEVAMAM